MTYNDLLREADEEGILVIENARFDSKSDGLINGDVIGINRTVRTSAKKGCVLAEELGHYYTSTGDILNLSSAANRKQEHRARVWAYNRLIGLTGIIQCHKRRCYTANDMADYLNVTEDFLREAIAYYRSKYGEYVRLDNYVIYFEPSIGVFESI